MTNIQPVRGTKDLFGEAIDNFNLIIEVAKEQSKLFNFEELQTPIFEFSEIFERNLGESSDIISKEVYKFKDRSDHNLTLRPEFTAGIVRALISNGELSQILPRKFFSFGPIFRYDRPQKGRQRQFNQINFEVFGEDDIYSDVELILLANNILQDLGVIDRVSLQINSLGCENNKLSFELELKNYFTKYKNELSDYSKLRLEQNPLRILDSKEESDRKLFKEAPQIDQFYTYETKIRFEKILKQLDELKIKYLINNQLVRGLDYYSSTVFEFVTESEGSQNAILAGGRYDKLVKQMGGPDISAIGFAGGVERLMLIGEKKPKKDRLITVNYVSENEKPTAFKISNQLRKNGYKVEFHFSGNIKKQLKKSNQNNAYLAIIIGEDEVKSNQLIVKNLEKGLEKKINQQSLTKYLEKLL